MASKKTKIDFRYERKFIAPIHMSDLMPSFVEAALFDFSEIYIQRRINSIYFDTGRFDFAHQHINGDQERMKVRIRYYGKQYKVKNSFLEFKIKNGLLGYKKKYQLNDFDNNFNHKSIFNSLDAYDIKRKILCDLNLLEPIVFVTYIRSYYLSLCGRFRITYDRDIEYSSLLGSKLLLPDNNNFIEEKFCLLELKYNRDYDQYAHNISKRLNLRISNNSKYINALFYNGIISR